MNACAKALDAHIWHLVRGADQSSPRELGRKRRRNKTAPAWAAGAGCARVRGWAGGAGSIGTPSALRCVCASAKQRKEQDSIHPGISSDRI